MAVGREGLRDWHRIFGLLLTDFFAGSPFGVEVERDLSVQRQLLDVAIIRRGRGRFVGRLPDGLEGLRPHNLLQQIPPHSLGAVVAAGRLEAVALQVENILLAQQAELPVGRVPFREVDLAPPAGQPRLPRGRWGDRLVRRVFDDFVEVECCRLLAL
jgi:hypothetical protein